MRLVFVALLLVLTACGQPGGDASGAPDPLRGKTFLATAVTEDGKPRELVAELSVEFTDDGRLIARAGCNMMQGQVDTADGKLVVAGGLSMTGMGCDQARHEQDTFVMGVLGASPSWQLTDSGLTITSGTTTFEMAPREAVHPDRELAGTTWELDTLIEGQTASSMTAGAAPVTLVFDGKTVVADTHCNGVSADYTVSGDTIEFTLGVMTKMACEPDIARGETAVVGVLQGTTTYKITADRLTLTSSSGKGIALHATPERSSGETLRGRTFLDTSITDNGKPYSMATGTKLSLEFTDDGRLIAHAGCNQFQGEVDTSGGKLVVKEGVTTDMSCGGARLAQDNFLMSVLDASPSWQLADDRLTITSGTKTFELAPREAVAPDQELTGRTWVLDTMLDGAAATNMPAGAPEMTVVFDGQHVRAETHCNGVSGRYTVSGDTIWVDSFDMTLMACSPEIMQGESAMAATLAGEATYKITADRLTITHSSGKGIQLHAK